MIFLFQGVIFRFHINFRGCTGYFGCYFWLWFCVVLIVQTFGQLVRSMGSLTLATKAEPCYLVFDRGSFYPFIYGV